MVIKKILEKLGKGNGNGKSNGSGEQRGELVPVGSVKTYPVGPLSTYRVKDPEAERIAHEAYQRATRILVFLGLNEPSQRRLLGISSLDLEHKGTKTELDLAETVLACLNNGGEVYSAQIDVECAPHLNPSYQKLFGLAIQYRKNPSNPLVGGKT